MNGVHDMGGMHGFGPVDPTDDATFHAEWEQRVSVIVELALQQDFYNIDAFRYGIERMDPATHLASSYFERWLASVEHNLVLAGVLAEGEVAARAGEIARNPDAGPRRAADGEHPWQVPDWPEEPEMPHIRPRFAVGDAVVTHNMHPSHHTRLPRYARGKRGTINMVHGPEVFADTNAHNQGLNPQVVYSVRFDADELWGESAEPRQTVSIDLWESYLEPAAEGRSEP